MSPSVNQAFSNNMHVITIKKGHFIYLHNKNKIKLKPHKKIWFFFSNPKCVGYFFLIWGYETAFYKLLYLPYIENSQNLWQSKYVIFTLLYTFFKSFALKRQRRNFGPGLPIITTNLTTHKTFKMSFLKELRNFSNLYFYLKMKVFR